MTYLSFVIATLMLLFSNTKDQPASQALYTFLNNAYQIQVFSLIVMVGVTLLMFLVAAITTGGGRKISAFGCFGIWGVTVSTIFTVAHWVGLKILENLVGSVDPTIGITDPARFWVLIVILFLIGIG